MRLNKSDLLEKLRLGEDSYIECKEVRFSGERITGPHRDSLADELAAFSNAATQEGVLLLGVKDHTREIVGIPIDKLDTVFIWIRDVCLDLIKPPINPIIERTTLPDSAGIEKPIIRIDIQRSLFVHKSPSGYFHRVGDSKREMTPDYLARLLQQRSQTRIIRFDEQVVPGTSLADLDKELYERFRTMRSDDSAESFLMKMGLAKKDDDGRIGATVSGILLASREPRKWLPNAYIQAVAYRGTHIASRSTGSYQIDAQDITGPLDTQVLNACAFVVKNMKVAAVKHAGRRDFPDYDITAVFEAMVNAVAHRDYSIYGSKIRLRLFADRLELFSPGGIPNTMTVESLPYRQSSRNEMISSLLAKCRMPESTLEMTDRTTMMDKRGEGVPIILDRSEQLSGKKPLYSLIDQSELLLTIYASDASNASEKTSEDG